MSFSVVVSNPLTSGFAQGINMATQLIGDPQKEALEKAQVANIPLTQQLIRAKIQQALHPANQQMPYDVDQLGRMFNKLTGAQGSPVAAVSPPGTTAPQPQGQVPGQNLMGQSTMPTTGTGVIPSTFQQLLASMGTGTQTSPAGTPAMTAPAPTPQTNVGTTGGMSQLSTQPTVGTQPQVPPTPSMGGQSLMQSAISHALNLPGAQQTQPSPQGRLAFTATSPMSIYSSNKNVIRRDPTGQLTSLSNPSSGAMDFAQKIGYGQVEADNLFKPAVHSVNLYNTPGLGKTKLFKDVMLANAGLATQALKNQLINLKAATMNKKAVTGSFIRMEGLTPGQKTIFSTQKDIFDSDLVNLVNMMPLALKNAGSDLGKKWQEESSSAGLRYLRSGEPLRVSTTLAGATQPSSFSPLGARPTTLSTGRGTTSQSQPLKPGMVKVRKDGWDYAIRRSDLPAALKGGGTLVG